ncbi:peptidase M23 [Sinimarinibacterium sp. CAU 1509]|uniref:peptidoglycan DD-metalloendopeptidase family protein n=1 Tax=Sinimarinibacterium sp. CAU 1509 TaxID=2562283 RepID=UPI0010AD50C5|nr:peptidoglycan DD-metalloendopeptidase family protein [Sinimarinibacterium sp. CAU 1509]TJY61922.1 peptidase M23 [Sinimarinibacterium sp. CAU 1509]
MKSISPGTADPLLERLSNTPAASVLPFAPSSHRCLHLDLSATNHALGDIDSINPVSFGTWIEAQRRAAGADYAAGGYAEDRPLYSNSPTFVSDPADPESARTLHLGVDLWLATATPVFSALPGRIHSAQDNAGDHDYGPTLILEHCLDNQTFYCLYGHLARRSLTLHKVGDTVAAGDRLGWLGAINENGGWPAHLHFQIIRELDGHHGDFPGVCRPSERAQWLHRCPDPNHLLRIDALRAPPGSTQ